MDDLSERRVSALITDLGFQAAEIRTQGALLAHVCLRKDRAAVRVLAEDLMVRYVKFAETYQRLVIVDHTDFGVSEPAAPKPGQGHLTADGGDPGQL
ncbi:MAG TPA: hypothetical protein VMA73_34560 [Streptosporangiaceae bacterium]|nr:hypothetical protein [Streptosporangiaceae bacterium]